MDNLKPIEQSIKEWLNYYADEYSNGVIDELPEALLLNIPDLLIEDGYTAKQINNAKGYCFYIRDK